MGDARRYDAWAMEIASGDWIGQDVFYQAPLYPYFLGSLYAIAGHSLLMVRVCQAVIGTTACVLLALAARRLYSERAGLIAGLGLALYAPAIFSDGLLQKTVLDLFFVCLVLWIISGLVDEPAKRSRWFWLGMSLGGLALTRENALAIVGAILLLPPGRSQSAQPHRLLHAGVLVLGLAVVLLPVAARNRIVGGEWHLTTSQFGPNLYIGNNPHADGTYGALREGRGSPEYERQDATEIAEAAAGRRLTPGEVSSFWVRQTMEFVRSQPGAWLTLMGRKAVLLWNRTEFVDTESQASYEDSSSLLLRPGACRPFRHPGAVCGSRDHRDMARSIAGRRVLRHRRRLRGQRRALLRVCPIPDAVGAASHPLRRRRVGVADDVPAHRGCSEDCCRCRDNRGSDDYYEPAAAVGGPHASDDRDKPRRCASDRWAAARS